jgi:ribosome biogenesis SPOUT family RNA methylase Rps3
MNFAETCLLDMKAEKILDPSDNFAAVVFGGILGNVHVHADGTYSSDDKTAIVRQLGYSENRRHLGELQMTTDTAVLVTMEIAKNKTPFEKLDFIDHPEIPAPSGDCTVMEGFRYLSKKSEIVIPPGMAQLLA